ncbi:hypothetical protein V1477_005556 [Vespula maculifrons]|uniref:Uncharacterized protein n=1 Tax=Vespula maculifrons TaxID=7453 RepID=A0ABD2CQ16_VESMC
MNHREPTVALIAAPMDHRSVATAVEGNDDGGSSSNVSGSASASASDDGSGALSVVQAYCSSDTKQSAYKVAAAATAAASAAAAAAAAAVGAGAGAGAFAAAKAKPRREEDQEEEGEVERVGIVYRANQNQPFQRATTTTIVTPPPPPTSLPLFHPSRGSTRMQRACTYLAEKTVRLNEKGESVSAKARGPMNYEELSDRERELQHEMKISLADCTLTPL